MGRYQFEFFRRLTLRGWRHFFRLRAPNGEIILQSQPYTRRASAEDTVRTIKRAAGAAIMVQVDD